MILDLVQIFRARKDRALASKLAVKFAQGQMLDRAAAPLLPVHVILWALSIVSGSLCLLLLYAAWQWHWTFILLATIPAFISVIAVKVSLRLMAGLDRIRTYAEGYSDQTIDTFFSETSVQDDDTQVTSPASAEEQS